MLKRDFNLIYQQQAGEENKGGGSGSEGKTSAFTQEQYDQLKQQNETMQQENSSMKGKMDELLTETKQAKRAKKESEEAARSASDEQAKKQGNFEQLYQWSYLR